MTNPDHRKILDDLRDGVIRLKQDDSKYYDLALDDVLALIDMHRTALPTPPPVANDAVELVPGLEALAHELQIDGFHKQANLIHRAIAAMQPAAVAIDDAAYEIGTLNEVLFETAQRMARCCAKAWGLSCK